MSLILDISVSVDGFVAGPDATLDQPLGRGRSEDTRLNSSHVEISYAVFCLKKKTTVGGRAREDPDPGRARPGPLEAHPLARGSVRVARGRSGVTRAGRRSRLRRGR